MLLQTMRAVVDRRPNTSLRLAPQTMPVVRRLPEPTPGPRDLLPWADPYIASLHRQNERQMEQQRERHLVRRPDRRIVRAR
jgi:hypothetical protein